MSEKGQKLPLIILTTTGVIFLKTLINQAFEASSIATAQATVIPTMGLLPKSYTLLDWSYMFKKLAIYRDGVSVFVLICFDMSLLLLVWSVDFLWINPPIYTVS